MVTRPRAGAATTPASADDAAGDAQAPWRHHNLLDVDVLSPAEIERLLQSAAAMEEVLQRRVARTPTLRGVTLVTLFYEASTRTRASFELAGKVLGADVVNLSSGGSSVEKGESLVDTVRTIEAIGADVVVMRHPQAGAPYLAARHCEAHLINAGDGAHAHPTQALLDAYTLRKALGTLQGKRICIVGDIKHSRVARSNLWALSALGAEVTLVGPRSLMPPALDQEHPFGLPAVTVEHDLDRALDGADAVMALRLQRERAAGVQVPSIREYARRYQVTQARLARAKKGAPVLHPGPMNEGVEIAPEVAEGVQSEIERQVQHGVAVRMAVLYLIVRGGA